MAAPNSPDNRSQRDALKGETKLSAQVTHPAIQSWEKLIMNNEGVVRHPMLHSRSSPTAPAPRRNA